MFYVVIAVFTCKLTNFTHFVGINGTFQEVSYNVSLVFSFVCCSETIQSSVCIYAN